MIKLAWRTVLFSAFPALLLGADASFSTQNLPPLEKPSSVLSLPVASSYIPGEILVKFRKEISISAAESVLVRSGGLEWRTLGINGPVRVRLSPGQSVEDAVVNYRNQPGVEYAEPNYTRRAMIAPLDPLFSRQWGLHNTGGTLFGTDPPISGVPQGDIGATRAWDIIRENPSVLIAVIDSGADPRHPDLGDEDTNNNGVLDPDEDLNKNHVLDPGEDLNGNGVLDTEEDINKNGILDPGEDLNLNGTLDLLEDQNKNGLIDRGNLALNSGEDIYGNGIPDPLDYNAFDNDGNGFEDDLQGWNFFGNQVCSLVSGQCSCSPDDPVGNNDISDDFGHGTAVAGILGAKSNNSLGVAGVLWSANILPLKISGPSGCSSVGDELEAIDYAVQKGARIILLPIGGHSFVQAEYDRLRAAGDNGILIVTPAGNDRSDNDRRPVYPASYDLPNLISVGASNFHDEAAYFSNFGHHTVHVTAPGDCVFTTLPTGPFSLEQDTNFDCTQLKFRKNYDYVSGTSFSAAYVAGIAALLLGDDPSLTPLQIKTILVATSDTRISLRNRSVSGGRVDAYRALTRDTGSTLVGGTGGGGGCGMIRTYGENDPTPPATAWAAVLVLLGPLLLGSRAARRLARRARGFIPPYLMVGIILSAWALAPGAPAYGQEEPAPPGSERSGPSRYPHSLALKAGMHQYRSSEYIRTNSPFFDQRDMVSPAAEVDYTYEFHTHALFGLSAGHYDGSSHFKTICCSRISFSTYYGLATLKFFFRIHPPRIGEIRLYAGPGIGFYRFSRMVRVMGVGDEKTERLKGYHFTGGILVPVVNRINLLIETRYSTAVIKSANDLDEKLDIGGLTTFLGLSFGFPPLPFD